MTHGVTITEAEETLCPFLTMSIANPTMCQADGCRMWVWLDEHVKTSGDCGLKSRFSWPPLPRYRGKE